MPKDPVTGRFLGFQSPNYTPVPDELFDDLLAELSGAELKVLLYIIRKTFGWKKDSDNISLAQMMNGVRTRDGRTQDRGVGLSKKTLLGAINTLEEQGIIVTERRRSLERGDEPTTYRLNVAGFNPSENASGEISTPPVGEFLHQGGGAQITPGGWGNFYTTQETIEQEKLIQETNNSNIRKAPTSQKKGRAPFDQPPAEDFSTIRQVKPSALSKDPVALPARAVTGVKQGGAEAVGVTLLQRRRGRPSADEAEARRVVRQYIEDFGRELGDQAPRSSVTRAINLMQEAEVSLSIFISAMQDARKTTQKNTASIRKMGRGDTTFPQKNKMAYFFSVLEDQLGLRPADAVENGGGVQARGGSPRAR